MPQSGQRYATWLAGLIVLVGLVLMLGKLGAAWPFTTDDAYITLRYSRHLAVGEGLAWNLGEPRIEGYSNFLFVLIGAAAIRTGVEPIVVFKVLGSLALLVTSLVLFEWARRTTGPWLACLPFLILTSYLGSIWWSVSGLETAVYQLFVLLAAWLFATGLGPAAERRGANFALSTPRLVAAGLTTFLAALTRPEGPIVVMAMVAAILVYLLTDRLASTPGDSPAKSRARLKAGFRAIIVVILAFGLPYAVYFLWRWGYFGRLLPNSVYCKSSFDGDPYTLLRGFWTDWKYLVLLALVAPWHRVGITRIFTLLITVAYLMILIDVDPIIGYVNRHFLAIYPLLLLSATWSLQWLLGVGIRDRWRRRASLAIVSAAFLMVLLGHLGMVERLRISAGRYARRVTTRIQLGQWIEERLDADQWYLIGDTGVVPYMTRAKVLDAFCLNNLDATTTLRGSSPHRLAEAFLDSEPDLVIIHSEQSDRLAPPALNGIFPALVELPQMSTDYGPSRVFATPGGITHYFAFERTSVADRPSPLKGDTD